MLLRRIFIPIKLSLHHQNLKMYATIFLKTYFDYMFLTCCYPFCVKVSKKKFIIWQWPHQKYICVILTLLSSLWWIDELRDFSFGSVPYNLRIKNNTASVYFHNMRVIQIFYMRICVLRKVWWNQENVADIMNRIIKPDTPTPALKFEHNVAIKFGLGFIFGAHGVLRFIDTITERRFGLSNRKQLSFSRWWSNMVHAGRRNLFLDNVHDLGFFEYILGMGSAIGYLHRFYKHYWRIYLIKKIKGLNMFKNTF